MAPVATFVHRSECIALPKGWIREEVPRKNQHLLGGKSDIYYISPMGKKIKSKVELIKAMGEHYDLKAFDYVTGTMNPLLVRSKPRSEPVDGRKRYRPPNYDFTKSILLEGAFRAPLRQTASIFPQPVTIKKSHTTETRTDAGPKLIEKPRQLLWEKRLLGIKPAYLDDDFKPLSFPGIAKLLGSTFGSDKTMSDSLQLTKDSSQNTSSASSSTCETLSKAVPEDNPPVLAEAVSG